MAWYRYHRSTQNPNLVPSSFSICLNERYLLASTLICFMKTRQKLFTCYIGIVYIERNIFCKPNQKTPENSPLLSTQLPSFVWLPAVQTIGRPPCMASTANIIANRLKSERHASNPTGQNVPRNKSCRSSCSQSASYMRLGWCRFSSLCRFRNRRI